MCAGIGRLDAAESEHTCETIEMHGSVDLAGDVVVVVVFEWGMIHSPVRAGVVFVSV